MTELLLRPLDRRTHSEIGAGEWPAQPLRPLARGKRVPSRPASAFLPEGDADPEAARRCRRALDDLLAHRGHPAEAIDGILADHPESIAAHCLRLAAIVRDDNRAAEAALAASIAAITVAGSAADEHAHRHAAAAALWLEGDLPALEGYAAIVAERPRDIVALAVAHALDFRLGNRSMLRDRIAAVLGHWDESVPGYPAILAMCAFGLEENGAYHDAERLARRALALEPGFAPAIHVLAHVMEMEGRPREGLDLLAAHESAWADGNGFSVHLAWHRALFHLQLNDEAAALAVYDAQIAGSSLPYLSVLADASALLWRLTLRNVDSGARWQRLADHWEKARLSDARPFFRVHAMMAFAAAARRDAATRLLDSLPPVDISGETSALPEQALALPVCKALLAFAAQDYAGCLAWLERVNHIAHRCGGSLAQCDVSRLTFVEATRRAARARWAA